MRLFEGGLEVVLKLMNRLTVDHVLAFSGDLFMDILIREAILSD